MQSTFLIRLCYLGLVFVFKSNVRLCGAFLTRPQLQLCFKISSKLSVGRRSSPSSIKSTCKLQFLRGHLRISAKGAEAEDWTQKDHDSDQPYEGTVEEQNYKWTSKTFSVALPALAGMMTDPVLSMVDTLFVGRLGGAGPDVAVQQSSGLWGVGKGGETAGSSCGSSIPLAALGACTSIFHLAFHCFRATTQSTASLVSSALVRDEQQGLDSNKHRDVQSNNKNSRNKDPKTPQREAILISQTSLQQSLVSGAFLTTFLFVCGTRCLHAMGVSTNNASLFDSAKTYLLHRSIAAPAVVMLSAAEGIFRGYGDVITPWKVSSIVSLLNLVLDPFCMFGGGRENFGLGMGIKGAAVATAASQVGGSLLYGYLLFTKGLLGEKMPEKIGQLFRRDRLSHSANEMDSPDNIVEEFGSEQSKPAQKRQKREVARTIFRANVSMVAKQGSLLLGWAYATSRATRMGPETVAAHQLALSIWMVVSLVLEGAGVAAQVLMSKEWEELRMVEFSKKDADSATSSPAQRQLRKIHSLSKYMINLSILQGIIGAFVVYLLYKASPSFILTSDPQVRHQLLSLLPHLAAQMPLVSATLITESLVVGGGRFKWLAGGTAVSSMFSMFILNRSQDLIHIWSGGIVALFAGRLITAVLGILDMNGFFKFNKSTAVEDALA
mmetsp:Transcript_1773/g.3420  ORF Transcript_1773/g.3420 Transcript_1773/m.3420 type:complete len:665 (+) Transcript_1773:395-2389(+)